MKYLLKKISLLSLLVVTTSVTMQAKSPSRHSNDPFYKALRVSWHGLKTLAGLASIGYGIANTFNASEAYADNSVWKLIKKVFNPNARKADDTKWEMGDRFEVIQNTFVAPILGFKILKSGIKGLRKEFSENKQEPYRYEEHRYAR